MLCRLLSSSDQGTCRSRIGSVLTPTPHAHACKLESEYAVARSSRLTSTHFVTVSPWVFSTTPRIPLPQLPAADPKISCDEVSDGRAAESLRSKQSVSSDASTPAQSSFFAEPYAGFAQPSKRRSRSLSTIPSGRTSGAVSSEGLSSHPLADCPSKEHVFSSPAMPQSRPTIINADSHEGVPEKKKGGCMLRVTDMQLSM